MKPDYRSRGAKAVHLLQEADALEARKPIYFGERAVNGAQAAELRTEAQELLKPTGLLCEGTTEAALWDPDPSDPHYARETRLFNTLENPDTVSVSASEQRMLAAEKAGVLNPAMDAAASIGAKNSLEKMLSHQMATAHHTAMSMLARATDSRLPAVDAVRLTNAAARLMDAYQNGITALVRLRTGGQQRVHVQYVAVGDGGRALVAGQVGRGSRRNGRGRTKNGG